MTNTPNTPGPITGTDSEPPETEPAEPRAAAKTEAEAEPIAEVAARLREKDRVVLTLIAAGQIDVRAIREATETRTGVATLSNAEINWAVDKLSDAGLVTVERFPGERVTRTVAGQQRSFDRPKEVQLTPRGEQVAAQLDEGLGQYAPMEHGELVRTVRQLDQRMADLEETMELQRQQLLQKLQEATSRDGR